MTNCRDCYEVAKIRNLQIVHAIETQFPADRSRRLRQLKGQNNGKWRLTTKNPDLYRGFDFLVHRGENLGTLQFVTEEKRVDPHGNVRFVRTQQRTGKETQDGDNGEELLITLVGADEPRFEHVTDAELIQRIVNMNVGRIKIPIRQQPYKDSNELTGNKYFVLKDLKPGDKDKLPDSFDFWDEAEGRSGKMWLSWNGKKRSCKHCKKYHEGQCDLMSLAARLEEERDKVIEENNNKLPIKTYANSELRRACQEAFWQAMWTACREDRRVTC